MAKKQRNPTLPKAFTPAPRATVKDYRTERFVPYIMRAEIGIHEAATIESSINDAAVRHTLHRLIGQLKRGDQIASGAESGDGSDDLIEWRIKDNLAQVFAQDGPISNADLIGCFGVILKSIDTWTGPPLGQRGYLGHLSGFMQQLGVNVRQVTPREAAQMSLEMPEADLRDYDPDVMTFEELGDYWLAHDDDYIDLMDDFSNRAQLEIDQGNAEAVLQVCRALLPRTPNPSQQGELYLHIGVVLRDLGQLEDSVEALQSAIELEDGFYGAMIELGETYFAQGDYRRALKIWQREQKESGNTPTWLDIARACRLLGDLQGEERALRHYIEHHPSSVEALARLANCTRGQRKKRDAEMFALRVVSTLPGDTAWFEDWAHWLRLKREMPGYEPDPLVALEELGQERPTGWVNLLKAVVYDERGNLAAVQRELRTARQDALFAHAEKRYLGA
ncbi:MAG: hypothetical protein CVU38_15755 [Chloroflexi bacterium HGW-Chloroflexi-1]|nr:MAG: hypothetical protein CVU38_15755 [Chloroflexi bacterium HGW-Chloroflexi-1]